MPLLLRLSIQKNETFEIKFSSNSYSLSSSCMLFLVYFSASVRSLSLSKSACVKTTISELFFEFFSVSTMKLISFFVELCEAFIRWIIASLSYIKFFVSSSRKTTVSSSPGVSTIFILSFKISEFRLISIIFIYFEISFFAEV